LLCEVTFWIISAISIYLNSSNLGNCSWY